MIAQMPAQRAIDPYDWPALLALLHRAFASMDGIIDPPSSLHRLTAAGIAEQARKGEVWVIGQPALACVFLTPRPDALYLGKLAVDPAHQGHGHARVLIEHAAQRARALGLPALELQTRIELRANHVAFRRMGFVKTAATAHPGYDRPTALTFRRAV
jgi:GNAT superfamily N-acetyltransferase